MTRGMMSRSSASVSYTHLVQLEVVKEKARPGETVLKVEHLTVPSHTQKRDAVHDVSFEARAGEILAVAVDAGDAQNLTRPGLEADIMDRDVYKRQFLG